jgi:APA family basic amino acid/polyamine antiporter
MKTELERSVRQRELMLAVIGTVIGSAIFLVPGIVIRQSGGYVGLAFAIWVIGGVLSLMGALSYGELGAMRPEAGGLYIYIRDAFGPLVAFLYGWTLFLVIGTGAVAGVAVAFGTYLDQLIPLSANGQKAAAVGMIASVAAINVLGTRKSVGVQSWATTLKVATILLLVIVLLGGSTGAAPVERVWPASFQTSLLLGAGTATIGVLWAYEGWQYLTFSAGEVVNPQKNFPRGLILGTVSVMALYLLANVAYIAALGADAASSERIAGDSAERVLGPVAGDLLAALIMVSIFSAANGLTLTTPRVFFAMARDGVFFRKLGQVHPRFGTPAFAVIASSIWTAVLAISGTYEILLTYVVFAGWIFYALGALTVIIFRHTEPTAVRPYRVPGYPFTPILFILAAVLLVLNTMYVQPERALLGLGGVLLGTPVYFIWRRALARSGEQEAARGAALEGK